MIVYNGVCRKETSRRQERKWACADLEFNLRGIAAAPSAQKNLKAMASTILPMGGSAWLRLSLFEQVIGADIVFDASAADAAPLFESEQLLQLLATGQSCVAYRALDACPGHDLLVFGGVTSALAFQVWASIEMSREESIMGAWRVSWGLASFG